MEQARKPVPADARNHTREKNAMLTVRAPYAALRSFFGNGLFLSATLLIAVLLPALRADGAAFTLRMAYLQNDLHHLAFWVGMEKGFLAEEGLAADVRGVFRSGPELMTAFGAGELDAAYVGEAPAAIAAVRGTAKVLLLAQANTEGSALVGAKDLKPDGAKRPVIAVPGRGSVQDLLLRKALPALGFHRDGVEIIVISPPEMQPALMTKEIDAFIAWEPYPAKALSAGAGQAAASSSGIWPNHPCCALIVSEKLAAENPEKARALLRAHRRATEFIAGNPEEAAAIAVSRTGMDADTVRRALANVKYTAVPDVAGLEEYLSFLNELGFIKVGDPKAFSRKFIASRFWETSGK
jgi:NitT/TauT family transport system substrate-binding protein